MPNSTISENLVINYTYPDPQYCIQTDIGTVRTLIVGTSYGIDYQYGRGPRVRTV